ncbi:alpha-L-rhamnosidase [Sphingobium sp.]|uniref:alpha-L-rhamnosidase n=1 Tax=Sphingobium sp. TaxID=1912891 RepID=UPI002B5BA192|nr:family 78 glycoside hydrolase catalytic domain [Sphingobium sp.]HUD94678.1 family 78 glycoside hydrolase catalytic domain [Sphingobium sp.]
MPALDRRSFLATGAILGLGAQKAVSAPSAGQGVTGLRVAMREAPIGIDDRRPALSWHMAGGTGARQTAYRILVASTAATLAQGRGDLWDSGRVESADCAGIAYSGRPLVSGQVCHWMVEVWNQAGTPARSAPATWEMGLLAPGDWTGDWLAVESATERDDRIAGAQWVGGPAPSPSEPRSFRLGFRSKAGDALLTIVGDGVMSVLMLDGEPLALPTRDPNAFGGAPATRLPLRLSAGNHSLTVEMAPTPGFFVKPFVSLAAQIRLEGAAEAERISGGWETRLGTVEEWAPAAPLEKQPVFPWPPAPARLLRRGFSLPGKVARARLHVAALGGYRIWLNGRRVNDDELQCEPANYTVRIPYRTYDVTALLRDGANAIGAMVGDGYYASYQAPNGRYAFGGAPRRVRMMLEIVRPDGQVEHVSTGPEWRHAEAPVQMSEIYAGEDQDLRLWPAGWDGPGFDEAGWDHGWKAPVPDAPCAAALADPVRVMGTLAPVTIRRLGPTRHIVDFGQNFAGRVRLQVKGAAGQEIVVRHAEILAANGEPDRRNLRAARAEDRYRLRGAGAAEILEPVFSYQGFRYAQVDGLPVLTADMVTGIRLSSAMAETGTFEIDAPDIQKLWLNTLWSQRSNFMGIPTDCPQRDERLGWTGDAQIFWDAASFNMDVGAFTRSYGRILREAQGANGAYPLWAPSPDGLGWGTDSATPGWSDAGVMLPYIAYLHSGDRTIVDENWAAMTAYVEGIAAANPDGLWSKGRGADLGDWLALDAKSPMDETTPKALIGTAMFARSAQQLAQMAAWTGRADEAARWRSLRARIAAAFAAAFVKPDGTVGNGSHCSYILALSLGLLPDGLQTKSGALLAGDIRRRGTLLSTGFLGTPLALDALAAAGEDRLAWDLLLRTGFPSWGYMVRKGATTIWERWNGDTGDVAMNSFNHYALGAVCGFLYRRVAGIEPIEPGFKRFRIAPLFDERVSRCRASVKTVRGPIEIGWRVASGAGTLDIVVPANSTAELRLSSGDRLFGPGVHRISF